MPSRTQTDCGSRDENDRRRKAEKMKRRKLKRAACAALAACVLGGLLPAAAYASSPEFSRTAEEWASLRDNKMEYWELEGLVQEYNPTVQKNQYDYRQFRKDYGDTNDEISNEYRRLANELRDDIVYPDADDLAYAMGMVAALNAEIQAYTLEQQADNNLEDGESIRLNYEMAEKALAQTAQNNFITWHSDVLAIRQSELSKQLSELSLEAANAQAAVGMGTQIQVLNAQQAVQNAEKALIQARSDEAATKQKLQIMLGWKADGQPEIGEVPALDLSRIDRMNPQADLAAALENNYTLRVNKRRLANSLNETDYNTVLSSIGDNEARIATSLQTAYQNVLNAKNTYLYQQANAALTAQTAAQTEQRFGLGAASRIDRDTAAIGAEQAQIALKQSEYALQQAMEAYDWAVKGLAAAEAGA